MYSFIVVLIIRAGIVVFLITGCVSIKQSMN